MLLSTSKAPMAWWPLALRQAVEVRHREQLRALGIPQLPVIPFGTVCMAKVKRWHKRDGEEGKWRFPMRRVVVWGPASDMSSTSRGYYVQAGDSWMKTTVVIIPNNRYLPEVRPQLPQLPPGDRQEDDEYAPTSPEAVFQDDQAQEAFGAAVEELPAAPEDEEQDDDGAPLPDALLVEHPEHWGEIPRRIMGKTPPDQVHSSYTQGVRTLQVRGEWSAWATSADAVSEEEKRLRGLWELQHRELRKLEVEERYLLGENEANLGHLVNEVSRESK